MLLQLDIEMSFATGATVIATIESLVRRLWSDLLDVQLPAQPFPQITFEEAMCKYGSDKPDIRLGMEVCVWRL